MDIINPYSKEIITADGLVCGHKLKLEVNRVGFRSTGSVIATWGETTVLANVVIGQVNKDLDYFPLSVDYEEKFYASGKISGSRYIKREGRPSDEAILTSRLIDRSIRPLFAKDFKNQTTVATTILSFDPKLGADLPAIIAASTAVLMTGAPFAGPVAGCRVSLDKDGKLTSNPDRSNLEENRLDLLVASNSQGVMMVESRASQVPEETIIEGFKVGHLENQKALKIQTELIEKLEVTPLEYESQQVSEAIKSHVDQFLKEKVKKEDIVGDYQTRQGRLEELKQELIETIDDENDQGFYLGYFEKSIDKALRCLIVDDKKRPDGRGFDEVRPLSSQVGWLPRTHGSSIFTRGLTQAANIITLAPPSAAQLVETMATDGEKFYFHHYNAPAYTVGEARRPGSPGRREIGHSYLAEKAIKEILPSQEDFPYTIRSVTEILSQHGSTSMAAVCSSCLALMDAGVPIKAPIAGLAMGLIIDDKVDKPIVLTDIQDAEDFAGDMDLKVAGSKDGITALQMDIKVNGLPVEILETALMSAKTGRLKILEHLRQVIDQPRQELSQYAPRVITLKINPDRIRDLIGKGGETIQGLVRDTNCQIDVQDDGQVLVFSTNEADGKRAVVAIKDLTDEPEVGKIYKDKAIVKILDFGMFVSILPKKDGMIHVSKLNDQKLSDFEVGDKVNVKLISIDHSGRLSLRLIKK